MKHSQMIAMRLFLFLGIFVVGVSFFATFPSSAEADCAPFTLPASSTCTGSAVNIPSLPSISGWGEIAAGTTYWANCSAPGVGSHPACEWACINGTLTGRDISAFLNPTCPNGPAPTPVNGACAATHYACTAGTSANNVSGTTSYTWNCNGANGGTSTSCLESKPTGTVAVSSNIAASWTITGPATIFGSGTSQTSLAQPTGPYTITWGDVSGYTKPGSSSLTLVNGGTISFSGTYIVSSYSCTGTVPANATAYAGDDTGLSSNTARSYSASNTLPKCQYSCNGGYSWNGSSCVAPTYSCTGSIPGNASMFPNDNVGLLANTPYTYWAFDTGTRCQYSCNGGYDWNGSACVLPTPTLQICRDGVPIVQGGGTYGFLLSTGDTMNIKAYYDSNVTSGNQCDAGSTDVTASATFTEANSSGGALSLSAIGTNPRVFTGASSGTETVTVTHSGQTATMSATVTLVCNSNCSAQAGSHCQGETFNTANSCGTPETCTNAGTRYCDFNWKEVTPGQ